MENRFPSSVWIVNMLHPVSMPPLNGATELENQVNENCSIVIHLRSPSSHTNKPLCVCLCVCVPVKPTYIRVFSRMLQLFTFREFSRVAASVSDTRTEWKPITLLEQLKTSKYTHTCMKSYTERGMLLSHFFLLLRCFFFDCVGKMTDTRFPSDLRPLCDYGNSNTTHFIHSGAYLMVTKQKASIQWRNMKHW